MTRIPIYQMTYGQDSQGKSGFIFSSEQENIGDQSVVFTIPIPDTFHSHPIDFIESFEFIKVYFPVEVNGEYVELEAKINFPELTFEVPKTNTTVTFVVDNENFLSWYYYFPFSKRQRKTTKYAGQHDKLIRRNNGFLTLLPIDLQEMDKLYTDHKVIFVGLTPNFGELDTSDQ